MRSGWLHDREIKAELFRFGDREKSSGSFANWHADVITMSRMRAAILPSMQMAFVIRARIMLDDELCQSTNNG